MATTNDTPNKLATTNDEIDAQQHAQRANQLTKRGFDHTMMAHENAATQALVAKATADVQARFVMAMRNPRELLAVRQAVLRECNRPGFAESAIYKLPRGGKEIRGLTIRFAEVAMRCFGNMSCEAQTLYDSDEERVVRVTTTDYESNATWHRDITIKKTKEVKQLKSGERPIRSRPNSFGDIVHLVPATDDDMRMKEGAEISRAARTAILRLIPGHIQDEAEELCETIIKTKIAKDPDGEKNRMVDAFAELDVLVPDLERLLGHQLDRITPAELRELKLTYNAIRAGEASVPDAIANAERAREKRTNAPKDASPTPAEATPPKEAKPATGTSTGASTGKGTAAAKDKIKNANASKDPPKAPDKTEAKTEAKTVAEPAPDIKPPPDKPADGFAPLPVKDGYEERDCADCGCKIEVPVADPPGAVCYSCSQA